MGTSMWINRQYPNERQDRECVKQIAYLVGIVLNDETPTTGWVTRMLRKILDSRGSVFLPPFVLGPLSGSHNWHARAVYGKIVLEHLR